MDNPNTTGYETIIHKNIDGVSFPNTCANKKEEYNTCTWKNIRDGVQESERESTSFKKKRIRENGLENNEKSSGSKVLKLGNN